LSGIFCIETDRWTGGARDRRRQPSVAPLLQLIAALQGTPYTHRRFSTWEDLQRLLRLATSRRYSDFPVIYVACHGETRRLALHRRRGAGTAGERSIALPELAQPLLGRGAGKLLVFSACRFMQGAPHELRRFVRVTGVDALMGYQCDVGWIESAQLELGLLAALTRDGTPDPASLAATLRALPSARALMRRLDFRVVPRSGRP
jgi:hypothetical protein